MNVVALGEIVVDWLSLTPGETISTASIFHRALGGNSTNVAIGLRRLGKNVQIVGKIGADFHADYLRHALELEGLSLQYVINDDRYPTAQCYMTTSAEGQHHFRNWPHPHAADMLHPDELPKALLQRAHLLHTTGISMVCEPRRSAVIEAIKIASEAGAIISFDAGFPSTAGDVARSLVATVLSQTHVLKMNEFEAHYWNGVPFEHKAKTDQLLSLGRKILDKYKPVALLLTCASRGSYVLSGEKVIQCAPLPVQAISEVGAGDAYIAGVIAGITEFVDPEKGSVVQQLQALDERAWRRIGLYGNIAGAYTTLEHNAYAGMPDQERLRQGMGVLSPETK